MAKSVINVIINAKTTGNNQVNQLTVDLRGVQEAAERASNSLKEWDLHQTITACGALSTSINNLMSSLDFATEGYKSFDAAMRAANTMAGKDAAGFDRLKDQVTELGKSIPLTRDALANGLYQAISNGVPEDNWLSFLEASAKSAVGGMADLGGVVTVTSTIIKNYGMEWSDAMAIQDKIQTTAKNGVTSFEQLQQALPRVTGNAAALGVSIGDLLASFSTLTGVSGNTAEVSTQLAAIFSALVKPSSEASKMAAEMGIQFDAAAIKAAGGFQSFIKQLDASVKAYAASSGTLEQEVYGRLFGSAESLRALIPLTGELAAKFDENAQAMADSAGVIGDAFEQRAQTSESKAQLMKNAWADVTDALGSVLAKIEPVTKALANAGMMATGVMALTAAFTKLNAAIKASSAASAILNKNLLSLKFIPIANTTAGVKALAASLNISAKSAAALGVALRGALLASGIGIAIWAVSAAITAVGESSRKAAEKEAQFRKELDEIRKTSRDISKSSDQAAAAEMAKIDALMGVIRDGTRTRKEQQSALDELKKQYPDYFSDLDIEKSKVEQLEKAYNDAATAIKKKAMATAVEEKMTENARKIVELEQQRDSQQKAYHNAFEEASNYRIMADSPYWNQNHRKSASIATSYTVTGVGSSSNYLNTVEKPLKKAEAAEKGTKAALDATEALLSQYQESQDYLTGLFQEYTAELSTNQKTPPNDEDKQKPAVPKETEAERAASIDVGEVRQRQLATLADYEKALADLRLKQKYASQEEYSEIEGIIKEVEKKRDAFKGLQEQAKPAPLSPEQVGLLPQGTLNEIDAKARELRRVQADASGEAVKGYQEQIDALERLRAEMVRIDKTEIKKKSNPFEDYTGIEKMRAGWGSIKGISSDVDSLTAAFDSSASAWERVCAGIDAAFGLLEHIGTIVGIVQSLTAATGAQTAAETAKGAATSASAGAQAAEAAMAETAAAAQLPVIAANKAATASFMELAAASYFAAHAYIPFAGFAIAQGFVTSSAATVQAVAAMPFADGGIVSGPTLGLIGEYAGASGNPEVVAPLDRLRDLIGPARETVVVGGTLRASGREIVCALANETRLAAKSGRRTSIRI